MKQKSKLRRFLPGIVIATVAVGCGGASIALIRNFLEKPAEQQKRLVQEVRLIRVPPPEELPPPPPPEEEEVPLDEPIEAPDPAMADAASAESLGIDAEGAAGGDGFGLLARRGGRDLLSGAGGSVYTWYAGRIKNEILDLLDDDARFRSKRYTVTVRLWVEGDGRVQRVALESSTGNSEIDAALREALDGLGRINEPPPPDMPQPVQLRIVSRS